MAERNPLHTAFIALLRVAVPLTLILIMSGAYVRLSDAGLGCPDWPGCYGQLLGVPQSPAEIAADFHGSRPLDSGKAWLEMAHRYVAAVLGLLIALMAVLAWFNRRDRHQPLVLPVMLPLLALAQVLLGMWTVTLLLKPLVVTAHLLGGMIIIALLWYTLLLTHPRLLPPPLPLRAARLRPYVFFVLLLLFAQIALGGWTSSNYAALACLDFPRCQGQWLPPLDFAAAVSPLFADSGQNFEFGILDNIARTTIHVVHRLGALSLSAASLIVLALLWKRGHAQLRAAALVSFGLLLIQLALGIANVLFGLPLAIATAHNGVAALLALSWLYLALALRPAVRS